MATGLTIDSQNDAMNTDRYQAQNLKTTSAKRVPYEELDFSVYKPTANMVAFSTSEQRMPLWIRVMKLRYENGLQNNNIIKSSWVEIDNSDDATKCEKVTVNLTSIQNPATLVTITAMITTGRIHIQGRYIKEWGSEEFPALLKMIDENVITDTDMKFNLDSFVSKTINKDTKTPNNPTNTEPNNHTPREKTMISMKNSLASLEADFIEFKQETNKTIGDLMDQNHCKDQEIKHLKGQISTLNDAKNQHQQNYSDLSLKHALLEEKITNLQRKHKTLEDKNSQILQQLTVMKQNMNTDHESPNSSVTENPLTQLKESTPTESDNQEHIYQVPTSNPFEPLSTTRANINETPASVSTPSKSNPIPESRQPHPHIQPDESTIHPEKSNNNTEPTHTPNCQTSGNPNPDTKKHKNSSETIILCDSNGRYLKPNLLCPGSSTSYIRCPTLERAKNIINNTKFDSPKTFIIHCGTNDIEHPETSNDQVINTLNEITTTLKSKHPDCKIILSSLLPRADSLDKRITELNQSLASNIKMKEITIVKHENILKTNLKDKKHLNLKGVKMFAYNLKSAYFGPYLNKPKQQ